MIYSKIFDLLRLSTPIMYIEVHDHVEFIRKLLAEYNKVKESGRSYNIILWSPLNTSVVELEDDSPGLEAVYPKTRIGNDPVKLLTNTIEQALTNTIIIFPLCNDLLKLKPFVHALSNFRSSFLARSTILLVDYSSAALPQEITAQAIILHDSLPDEQRIQELVAGILETNLPNLEKEEVEKQSKEAARILIGLTDFMVEQSTASALVKTGLNKKRLWEQKCIAINNTPGLNISLDNQKFEDIKGLQNIKNFAKMLLDNEKPDIVVWIDEIEKAIAGSSGEVADNTGVSQGILQQLLVYMQKIDCPGMILLGPPGTGKSAMAQAISGEANVPLISFDLGGLKSSLVGSTEANIRRALKTIDGMAKKQLWVATCNELKNIPAALRRRFGYGIWFFDLPTADETDAIWKYYKNKYELDQELPVPKSMNLVGAEIRTCCKLATTLKISIQEAAKFIVPISTSMAEELKELRSAAAGRYLSASEPGVYKPQVKSYQTRGVSLN